VRLSGTRLVYWWETGGLSALRSPLLRDVPAGQPVIISNGRYYAVESDAGRRVSVTDEEAGHITVVANVPGHSAGPEFVLVLELG
jgi:hypothetical protein